MNSKNTLICFFDEQSLIAKHLKARVEKNWQLDFRGKLEDPSQLSLAEGELAFFQGNICLSLNSKVARRSVGSHFLSYIDWVGVNRGELWGESLFSEAFYQSILGAFKNQNFKGAVIFLGDNPMSVPVVDTLAGFGFSQFDFLNLESENKSFQHIQSRVKGIFDTKASLVDSESFVRSQTEYSLCFVLYDHYEEQILDDMSYFHFLSNKSIVFDLSGQSNFLLKEVKALGVDLVDFDDLMASYMDIVEKRLSQLVSLD